MKKYLLISLTIALLILLSFLVKDVILAQFSSFEVYSGSGKAYPTVTSVVVNKSGNNVFIKANASDVSGVLSMIAQIRNPNASGQFMPTSGIMYDDGAHGDGAAGDGVYGVIIDISNTLTWQEGTYFVDIHATDRLFNNSWDESNGADYASAGSFTIGSTSADATLSGLTTTAGALSPTFSSSGTLYGVSVANNVTSVTVTPTANESHATIKVNGTTVVSGSASGSISLNVGINTVSIVVTAQDGTTTKTYTIIITRASALSSDATLSGLTTIAGTLIPTFSSNIINYAVAVSGSVSSTTVTPTANESHATMTVNGTTVVSGSASGAISLNLGINTVTIVVTAQDGVTTKTYSITIIRAVPISNDATLSGLAISAGTLSPTFTAGTIAYTAGVGDSVTSTTVTPTATESHATITVNGTTVVSGSASGAISLNVGNNTVTIVATAQDGTTTKTYTITIDRSTPANDFLSGWSYRKKIIISTTPTSNLADFPILVKITGDTSIGAGALSNGYDIRFTTADGSNTILPYEREDFTVTAGSATGNFWVKTPVYSSPTGSQNTFYIYYGNSGATSDWTAITSIIANCTSITNAQCAWKEGASQNFKGVWHMPAGSKFANDSTLLHTATKHRCHRYSRAYRWSSEF